MTPSPAPDTALERWPSGISGLDAVLGGGFFQSGVYIIYGQPGSGKTILANQICYRHANAGGSAAYVTLLAESHSRMLQHLRPLRFFDESVIPDRLSYLSAFHDLESEGLKGLMSLLRREMRARQVSVLVLDGLVAATEAAQTERELKKFIHELQTSAVFHGCTVFLLKSGTPDRVNAEHTMVDGIIELDDRLFDARAERSLQVRKFRGAGSLRGKHAFRISDDGIEVYPRIEALHQLAAEAGDSGAAVSTGVPSLDALIAHGGLPLASATAIVGSSGTGKTTLSLHFLAGSSAESPGLMVGFFESPARLRQKARSFGLNLQTLEGDGTLAVRWYAQGEHNIDELAHRLLDDVARLGIKRLVIDGLSGFLEAAVYPERTNRFLSCLTNELRRRGVTLMMTLETRDVVGSALATPYGVSGFVDNLVFLRLTEHRGLVKRAMSITKMRDSDYEAGVRELELSENGLRIGGIMSVDSDVITSARLHSAATSR